MFDQWITSCLFGKPLEGNEDRKYLFVPLRKIVFARGATTIEVGTNHIVEGCKNGENNNYCAGFAVKRAARI
jgi:hypothetical protein